MSWSYSSSSTSGAGCMLHQLTFLASARSVWFTIDDEDDNSNGKSSSTSSQEQPQTAVGNQSTMTSESAVKSSKSGGGVCPLRNIVLISVIVSRLSPAGNSSTTTTPLSTSLALCLVAFLIVVGIQHLRHSGGGHYGQVASKFWHPRHRTVTVSTTANLHQQKQPYGNASTMTPAWQIGPTFDPNLSTEDNYRSQHDLSPNDKDALCGKFVDIRREIDYKYHKVYSHERQHFQDALVESMLGSTSVQDNKDGRTCTKPERNWIVFTAGVMGAGKSYTIKQLHDKGRFPLDGFVAVDPDVVRQHFPEYSVYNTVAPERAGELTRKEAGVVSEILTEAALRRGQNVLVDGSLRNATWYQDLFLDLRTRYPKLQIGILHVTAPREAVFERAESRAEVTGRVVPRDLLEQVMEEVPKSLQILSKKVDFAVEILNAPHSDDVEIVTEGVTWDLFRRVWKQSCSMPPTLQPLSSQEPHHHGFFRANQILPPVVAVPAS